MTFADWLLQLEWFTDWLLQLGWVAFVSITAVMLTALAGMWVGFGLLLLEELWRAWRNG